ncbi:MAG TPA: sulfatase [Pirellulales bacterium]|nr:sulfatase [Pirellulales bacterium]
MWRVLCIFVVVAASFPGSGARAATAERPNIVFAFADDWGRYASAYGKLTSGTPSDLVSTPNFDRLAREGVLFTHAFVNAPSCTPCRSSLLSGQYFWRTGRGAILLGAVWDSSIPTFPLILRDRGYHIGFTYKVWSPGTPPDAPYGGQKFAYAGHGARFNRFSQFVSQQQDVEAGKQILYDEVRENFRDFLKARPSGKPFCYWFGPTNTHRDWIAGSGKALWGLDPDKLQGKLPGCLPDVPVVREDFADYLGEVQAFDTGVGVLLDELEKTGELENTLIVMTGDHGIPGFPHGKCNLYDLGVEVSLAIRWGSQVPGGRVVDDFVCLPDLCPTILEVAGQAPLDVMTGRSLLGVLTSGKSGTVDPTRDAVVVGRERHVALAREGNLPYPQRAIRTADFLYIRNFHPERWPMGEGPGFGKPPGPFPPADALRNDTFAAFADMDASPTKAWLIENRDDARWRTFFDYAFGLRPAEELYDLKNDPDQLHDVASQTEYAETKAKYRQRLMTVLAETGDPRVTGDGGTFDRPPYSDPVVVPSPKKR